MPRPYTLTMPGEDHLFGVTDEQLTALVAGGKDKSFDYFVGYGGVFLGFLPLTVPTIASMFKTGQIGASEAVYLIVALICFVMSVAKFLEHRKNHVDMTALEAKIRAGQKSTFS